MRRSTYRVILFGSGLAALVLWNIGWVMVPYGLHMGGHAGEYAAVWYRFLHGVCHQLPRRSFSWFGYPMGVCHRCSGTYLGLAVGWLIGMLHPLANPIRRRYLNVWIGAWAWFALDWLSGFLFDKNTPGSRFISGQVLGLWTGWYILSLLAQFLDRNEAYKP